MLGTLLESGQLCDEPHNCLLGFGNVHAGSCSRSFFGVQRQTGRGRRCTMQDCTRPRGQPYYAIDSCRAPAYLADLDHISQAMPVPDVARCYMNIIFLIYCPAARESTVRLHASCGMPCQFSGINLPDTLLEPSAR